MHNRKLIDYLPRHSQDIHEIRVIMDAEQPEIEKIWREAERVQQDVFLATASDAGLARWEKMLGISAKDSDTLEERRMRCLAKVNEQLPFTKRTLAESLTALCGDGGYKLHIGYGEYSVRVLVALAAKKMVAEVEALLRRVLPANLVIEVSLMYNQWEKIKGRTWGELLGKTWGAVKEETL